MIINFQKYIVTCFLGLAMFFSESATAQFDIPEIPEKQTSLYDYINLLSSSQKAALETKLIGYADSTSTQIVVAIISTSKGEDLSLLGAKWGQKWGIGQKDEDNGILMLLASDDRNIDINTGYGIEYRMSDRTTEQIINSIIIPQFKAGNYYEGLNLGSDAIFEALQGEFNEERDFNEEEDFGNYGFIIILIIFIIIIVFRSKKNGRGGKGGGRKTGYSLIDVIILSNMGRTGGHGGGSSGGGFSGGGGFGGGFGGGGFGGGGAGGSW